MGKKPKINKKHLIIGIIAVVLIVVFVNLGIKINFLANDELHIRIEPLQTSFEVVNNQDFELNFTVQNNNFWFCKTECELKLYDPYKEEYIDTEKIELDSNSKVEKNYVINLKETKEGQRDFYFEVVCNNIKTQVCQTKEKKIYRSAFANVNYVLDPDKAKLGSSLRPVLNKQSSQVNYALNLAKEIEQLSGKKTNLNKYIINLNEQKELWDQGRYEDIDVDESINKTIIDLENQKNDILQDTESYNLIVEIINGFEKNWPVLNNAYKLNNKDVQNVADTVNARIFVFNQSDFEDSSELTESFVNLNMSFFNILQEYNYSLVRDDLISRHWKVQSRLNYELETNYSINGDDCQKIMMLAENYKQINSNSNESLKDYEEYINNSEFLSLKKEFKKAVLLNLSVEPGFFINNTFYNNSLNLSARDYYSVLEFNDSSVLEFEDIACTNSSLDIDSGDYELINVSNYTQERLIDVDFEIGKPECCIFGECLECMKDPELYPVIFVHGHSPFEQSPVESSYKSLSKMQIKMGHESFVNMGDIDLDTLNQDWYGMSYPVAVKGSYYYTFYYDAGFSAVVKKSLSIENYAIRLKEIVENVKANTGAEKVNIIAHSMGGLVAREYILLFEEDDIDKLIVIGTPNQGISGRAKKFCSTIGNDKECEDMHKNSVFMKRLNNYVPDIEVYTIYGTGCDTDGQDGDGLIAAEDVKLEYAENIMVNGTCEDVLGVSLHRDMVDPEKYPVVYEIVTEIIDS
ncbi:MAG: hypothetical protein MAG795_00799 [Candidatus Woesearchaeota archaeon]|nr:hypothetical protein [Candidatus Woesearchaeota archaeon]